MATVAVASLPVRRQSVTMDTPLDELQWKSPEWIQAFGLRTDNVLEYFAESPFYDRMSNNQVIKMQRQFSQADTTTPGNGSGQQQMPLYQGASGAGALPHHQNNGQEFQHLDPMRRDILNRYPMHAMLERELSKLKGVEYVLAYVRESDFWIIKKQNRASPTQIAVLQTYYIIGANVYQSPTLFKVIQNRLLSTSAHLSKSLRGLQQLTYFQPSQGVQLKKYQDIMTSSVGSGAAMNTSPMFGTAPPTAASIGNNINNNDSTTSLAGGMSLPPTVVSVGPMTNGTVQQVGTAQFDAESGTPRLHNVLTEEVMDRLLVTSMKSAPEYI